MSMSYSPVYAQGAIFYGDDYDPVKVIIAVAEDEIGGLPPEIQTKLESDVYDQSTAEAICGLLDVKYDPSAVDYSFISNDYTDCLSSWVVDGIGEIQHGIVVSYYFTNLEAEFRYASEEVEDDCLDNCLMFILPSPFIWEIAEYNGPRSKQEVIEHIREAAQPLLKDDIDWERRIGDLIGTTYG